VIPRRRPFGRRRADPPFNRHPGETPAMTAQDEADTIAFLNTQNDKYKPEQ
jgi:cytochrome c peroxidase